MVLLGSASYKSPRGANIALPGTYVVTIRRGYVNDRSTRR
jgi:hypothetical protein